MKDTPLEMFYPYTKTGEAILIRGDGQIDIESYDQEFFMELQLEQLAITIRDSILRLTSPTSMSFHNQELSIGGLEIADSDKTQLQVSGNKNFDGTLDYHLIGQVDLKYLPSFLGFIDVAAGIAKIHGTLQGDPKSPIPQFDIKIEDGFFDVDTDGRHSVTRVQRFQSSTE